MGAEHLSSMLLELFGPLHTTCENNLRKIRSACSGFVRRVKEIVVDIYARDD